jgi:hypothetical protein
MTVSSEEQGFLRRWLGRARLPLVFGLACLYVRFCIDPRLVYVDLWQDPAFFLTWRFFADSVQRPGDLAQYAALFLSRFYSYPWAGALILAAIAFGVSLATGSFLATVGGVRPRLIHLIPAVFLLMVFGRYNYSLASTLSVLAATGLLAAYARLPLQGAIPRAAIFLALSAVLYGVAGGPALVFIVLGGLFEAAVRRRVVLGLVCLLGGLAVPWVVGVALFRMEMATAYRWQLPFYRRDERLADLFSLCLLAFLALAFLGALIGRAIRARRPVQGHRTPWLGGAVATAVLLGVGALAVSVSLDRNQRSRLQLELCAEEGRWADLVAQASSKGDWDAETRFLLHRALCHTGQLLENMLAYPQATRTLPLGWWVPTLNATQGSLTLLRLADFAFELGRVNACIHLASESLETQGERPRILRRLALAYVAKGNADAARVYLNALRSDVIHGGWARDALRQLDEDPSLPRHPDVARVRRSAQGEDHVPEHSILTRPEEGEASLLAVLKNDPGNRMAFDYLIAHWLLTGQLDKAVSRLPAFRGLGYASLPRHVQECVLFCSWRFPAKAIEMGGVTIDPAIRTRFEHFVSTVRLDRNPDLALLKPSLAAEFGDTLYYYFMYHESGSATKLPEAAKKGEAR